MTALMPRATGFLTYCRGTAAMMVYNGLPAIGAGRGRAWDLSDPGDRRRDGRDEMKPSNRGESLDWSGSGSHKLSGWGQSGDWTSRTLLLRRAVSV